jgi:two-component sensor histidine kinase
MPVESRSEIRVRSMARGLKSRDIAVLHQSPDSLYDLAENLPSAWPASKLIGCSDDEALPSELAAILTVAKTEATREGAATVEVELAGKNGSRRILEIEVIADSDSEGRNAGFILIMADITEIRERELALTSLMREVSHRSKNLLAIVQAVAMQTANHTDTTTNFLEKFRGRLRALAGTQDLVTESNWRGTSFRELAEIQFSRLGQPTVDGITVEGLNPMLGPNAALHVGLAIHELATNALLHGALGDGQHGHVRLTAQKPEGADKMLAIEWRETRPSNDTDNAPPHFGTLVLERIVPLAVHGVADYDVGANEVVYRLEAPMDQLAH